MLAHSIEVENCENRKLESTRTCFLRSKTVAVVTTLMRAIPCLEEILSN